MANGEHGGRRGPPLRSDGNVRPARDRGTSQAGDRRAGESQAGGRKGISSQRDPELPALPLEPPTELDDGDDEPTVVGNSIYGGPAFEGEQAWLDDAEPATEARLPLRAPDEDGGDAIPIETPATHDSSGPSVVGALSRSAAPVAREPGEGGGRASASAPAPADSAPPPQPAAPPSQMGEGRLIGGRYRIVKRIGEGGMGKVFEVTHAHLDKTFALKIIHHNFAGETRVRDLFYREARLASSLSHPNIVSVVDFGEDPEMGAFMVMEFLEGRRLNAVLHRETRLSVRPTCDIMLQVAEALHYIHARDIVHCDIKTENILLCEEPGSKRRRQVVKLLDFGLARSTASRNSASLSGTPHYVAPERIRGHEASPQSDIYGLGVLFYELLAGRTPWDGEVAHILSGHLEDTPEPPSAHVPEGLDPALDQLILRSLEKRPEDRHKDMAAFIYELNTVMDMLGFGRRNNRRGVRQKVAAPRGGESQRDELVRTVFDSMRLPMALLDSQGKIVVANAAFAKFIMGVSTEVEGLMAKETPLAKVWKNFAADLARAQGGAHLRRVVELDGAKGQTWRLLMWLDPDASGSEQVVFGVHPLDP